MGEEHLFKLQLLKRRDGNDYVFLGSSRFQDAIEVKHLEKWYKEHNGQKVKFFDASFRKPFFDEYTFTAKEVIKLNKTGRLVLELSNAIFLGREELEEKSLNTEGEKQNIVEETLKNFVYENSDLVKVRKSIGLTSLYKLYMVYTSQNKTHDLWLNPRVFKNYFYVKYKQYSPQELDKFKPIVIKPKSSVARRKMNPRLFELVEVLKKANKQIYFVKPPVIKETNEISDFDSIEKVYLEFGEGAVLLDYSKVEFPKGFMRDDLHMSVYGKLLFSQILARDLEKYKEESK
jgi:hypothetical protein